MTDSLFVLASVLFSARLMLLIVLHLVPGGVGPVRDPVSDYAVAERKSTRILAASASWVAAAAWISLGTAIVLDEALGVSRFGIGFWLLALGLILAVMPLVPTDRMGSQPTARGRVHMLFAIAWFTLAYSTIDPLGSLLGGHQGQVLGALNSVAGIALAALIVSLVLPALRARTFGIAERAFILGVTLAPLLTSIDLATRR